VYSSPTGRIDGDRLHTVRVQRVLERRPETEACSDAGEQQQRTPGGPGSTYAALRRRPLRIESPPWPLRGFPGQAPAQVTSQPTISACTVRPGSVKDLEIAHVVGNALSSRMPWWTLSDHRRSGFRRSPDQRPGSSARSP
jgi:hypothetical protein